LTELLRDLPELPQLTLMDDTPTANNETRGWLREVLAAEPASLPAMDLSADEQVVAAPKAAATAGRAMFDKAMAMLRSGQAEKAIQMLMAQTEQEKSARDRFLRRTDATDIMVQTGHEAVAMPILKELAAQIEQHSLEAWEAGETVARPLSLLYRSMSALGAESEDARQELYLRICRLDPMRAISFPGKNEPARAAPAAGQAAATPPPENPQVSDGQAGS
jgi:type VI secretion system protein ImpA